jgi:hypothetical protein
MNIIRTLLGVIFGLLGMLLALPLVVIGLPFWMVAFCTKTLSRMLQPTAASWEQLIEFEPTVGWKTKANLNTYALDLVDDTFHVTTDAAGWRIQMSSIEESDIVVFGDSFAFGAAADDAVFFTECHPQVRIKALGANGYNMVQELLWMERLAPQLQGKLVVWCIFLGNDLYDNLQPNLDHYRRPFVRRVNGTSEWEIVTSHISPAKWRHPSPGRWLQRLAEICRPTFLSERVHAACAFLIERGRDICRQADADLVVMTIPDVTQLQEGFLQRLVPLTQAPETLDPDLPDKKIKEICDRRGVRFVALKQYLGQDDYKEHEVHWNARGHQRVADVLSQLYRQDYISGFKTMTGLGASHEVDKHA